MDIALHMGAHLTDDGRLRSTLEKNQPLLHSVGIEVPEAAQFRTSILDAIKSHAQHGLDPDAGEMLLDSIVTSDTTERLVLSTARFLAPLPSAVRRAQLCPMAEPRVKALRALFGEHNVSLFLSIRNPASFIPALLGAVNDEQANIIRGDLEPTALRWSDLVRTIRDQFPEAPITIWCDEDTPFLWEDVLHAVSGYAGPEPLAHVYDWFDTVLVDGGAAKLAEYMENAPPMDRNQRQRVIAAFLDKFCDEAKIDVDVSTTGWSEDMVDLLSELYDDDVATLGAMDGVTLLQP
ncbi:MAG: hypothetical protein HLUCCA05_03160 [Roseibaca calidilacus]|uniref:Uncharacterized protein n=1 Tax=Roseibaca calidilacus TaxID=1666912 RepID=A0A0P7YXM2_9RHOB|nr:hypothetical protein [Roseibaca calidilacus]KPP95678.1 MAG: hypothetical protein HLUCCA05_03160 [Roseibaca calidilacus]CUX81898.1 hypothetical protein Ga0058931_2043 [Roseibaca calidilacus]